MKKIENRLENAFPSKFRSRYAMVCYGGDARFRWISMDFDGFLMIYLKI